MIKANLKRIFGKSKAKELPPPYSAPSSSSPSEKDQKAESTNEKPSTETAIPTSSTTTPKIHASSSPSSQWTHAQCRAWIVAILIHSGRTEAYAVERSTLFYGFGQTLWAKSWEEWLRIMGDDVFGVWIQLIKSYERESKAMGIISEIFEPLK